MIDNFDLRRSDQSLKPRISAGSSARISCQSVKHKPQKSSTLPPHDSPCHTGVSGGDDAAWLGRDEADLVPGGAQINIEVNDAPVGVVEHNRAGAICIYGVGRGAGFVVGDDDTVAVDGDHAGAGAVAVEGVEAGRGNRRGLALRGDRPAGLGVGVGAFQCRIAARNARSASSALAVPMTASVPTVARPQAEAKTAMRRIGATDCNILGLLHLRIKPG